MILQVTFLSCAGVITRSPHNRKLKAECMLHAPKWAHRIGLDVQFSHPLRFKMAGTHNRCGNIQKLPVHLRLMSESIQHACIMYSYPYMIFSTTLLLKSLLTYQHSNSYFNLLHCQNPKTTNFTNTLASEWIIMVGYWPNSPKADSSTSELTQWPAFQQVWLIKGVVKSRAWQ